LRSAVKWRCDHEGNREDRNCSALSDSSDMEEVDGEVEVLLWLYVSPPPDEIMEEGCVLEGVNEMSAEDDEELLCMP